MSWARQVDRPSQERSLACDLMDSKRVYVEVIVGLLDVRMRVQLPWESDRVLRILRGVCRVLGLELPSAADEAWLGEEKKEKTCRLNS